MGYTGIIVEKKDAIGYLTLNRPEKLNAISVHLKKEFEAACLDFRDDPNIKVFVIKGAGRAFCSGYDMSHPGTDTNVNPPEPIELLMRDPGNDETFWRCLWDNPKIVIAQVHSFCVGGGAQIACYSDVVYCSEDALFGDPPVRYAGSGSGYLWPVIIGLHKAMEYMVTGNMMTAQTALRTGFVNEVFPKDRLEAEIERLADTVAKLPMASLFINKRAVHEWYELMGIRTALRYSNRLNNITFGASPKALPHGLRDITRVTTEKGMKAGFEYMNKDFVKEDQIAKDQMARPDRKAE